MSIRIILVGDHNMLIDTLNLFWENEKDIKIVGVSNDGSIVHELAAVTRADAVVIDIGSPGIHGIDTTRRLVAAHLGIKVIALADFAEKRYVVKMLEIGASAFIVKKNTSSELLRALRAAMNGQKYLCSEIVAEGGANNGEYPMEVATKLCPRERLVLQHLAEGYTSAAIAKRMFIATTTVDVHRRNIKKKLDLHSVAELTKYAIRNGLTAV